MAVRRAFRFRRVTTRTIAGTTNIKRSSFTLGGSRALKSPFRQFENFRRLVRRRVGLERFLPRTVLRTGKIPLLGGFSFLGKSRGRGGAGAFRTVRSQVSPGGRGSGPTLSAPQIVRAVTAGLSAFAGRIERDGIQINFNRGNFQLGRPAPPPPAPPKPAGKRAPKRSPKRPPSHRTYRAKKKRPSPKASANAATARASKSATARRNASITRASVARSQPRLSRQEIIKRQLEGKKRKGIIKNIYFPGKPPKGRKRT